MSAALTQQAVEFLTKEADFVYQLYQATELEVRSTERYVLIGLGGLYSYLATKTIPDRFRKLAWYAPPFVVLFAGIRALGLGLRQKQLLEYLQVTEAKALEASGVIGWAQSFTNGKPIVATTAAVFYVLLFILTVAIAYRMTSRSSDGKVTGAT